MQTNFLQTIKRTTLSAILAIVLSMSISSSHGQELPEDLYFEIACFKAKTDKARVYFRDWAKPIHDEMIKRGIISDWEFYTVDYPNGSDCDCNYRAVRVFKGLKSLDKIKSRELREEIVMHIWPDKSLADVYAEFSKNVDFKYAEVFHLKDAVVPNKTTSELSIVNFMDVKAGQWDKYLEMEREVFKPVHSKAHKNGAMVDWFVAEREMPYGVNFKTDYITVDKFNSYEEIGLFRLLDLFSTVHPTKDGKKVMAEMATVRKLLKSEIWRYHPEISSE